MSVRYEDYKGEKILLMDFSGLRGQDYIDAIEEAENEILKNVNNTHRSKPQPNSRCEFGLEYYLTKEASSQ